MFRHKRIAVVPAVLLFASGASSALAATASPLPHRDAIVVDWEASPTVALLVTRTGRAYVVHGAPRLVAGQRVRIQGIRWGSPTPGIVWGPRRSAWGIETAQNGTFQSGLIVRGRAGTATIRARVVKRHQRAVLIAVPGATMTLPFRPGATWSRRSGVPAGRFGSTSVFRLAIDRRGRVSIRSAREVTSTRVGTSVPFAGRITGSNPAGGTINVSVGNAAQPTTIEILAPPGFDYARFAPGAFVSGWVRVTANTSRPPLVSIWLNGSFAEADSAGTGPGIPPGTPPPPGGGPTPPSPTGWPSAATTGVPAGVVLTPYAGPCTITAAGTVIDGKAINCNLAIQASNVTITRSKIAGTVDSGEGTTAASFTISDSEVDAGNQVNTGIGAVNFTATRVHVIGGNRSIHCFRNCTVQDSYVHGQFRDNTGQAHESGVRVGSQATIRHNTLVCDAPDVPPDAGCSASLTGYGDFATVENVTVDNNYFPPSTGGFCAYGGSSPGKPFASGTNNIRFTNNVFERGSRFCGYWGPITHFDVSRPGNTWSNNRWSTGAVVPPAN